MTLPQIERLLVFRPATPPCDPPDDCASAVVILCQGEVSTLVAECTGQLLSDWMGPYDTGLTHPPEPGMWLWDGQVTVHTNTNGIFWKGEYRRIDLVESMKVEQGLGPWEDFPPLPPHRGTPAPAAPSTGGAA